MEIKIQAASSRSYGHGKLGWLFCAAAFITPFVYWPGVYDYAVAPKEAFLQIGIMGSLALMIAGGYRIKIPKIFPLLLIFIAYAGLTSIWAVNPYAGLWLAISWLIYSLAILIAGNAVNREHLIKAIYFSALGAAGIGLAQYYLSLEWIPQTMPPASTFANKNYAAQFAAVALPLGFYFRRRVWTILGSLVLLSYIHAAGTRSALLAVGITLLFFLGIFIRRRVYPKIMTAVLAGVLIFGFYQISWKDMPRTELWQGTINMAAHNPPGVGLGNFAVQFPRYDIKGKTVLASRQFRAEYAHNEYLQLFAETGYIGAVLLLWLIIFSFRFLKWEPVIAAALLSIGIICFFSNPLRMPVIPFTGACLLGVIAK